jgi:hypothetical protein
VLADELEDGSVWKKKDERLTQGCLEVKAKECMKKCSGASVFTAFSLPLGVS